MTKDPRRAKQFVTKKEARKAAEEIGWLKSDVTPIEIMGFKMYAISDPHMRFVEQHEYELWKAQRAMGF